MATPAMRYLRRLLPVPAAATRADHRVLRLQEQLLLDSGRVFMLLGGLVLMWQLVINPLNAAEHVVFAAFLLWLLGVALALLSLAVRRFPRLAAAGAAAATAFRNQFRNYLLGGL
ncbi:unnamed protein product [Urochloa decumbens]|uniref:Uncharacterized protein n=1 Tax=Urochloa decumbens TaxID=240449 RepID=A0ABC9E9Q3_9POAL